MNPPTIDKRSETSRSTLATLGVALGLLTSSCDQAPDATASEGAKPSAPPQGLVLKGRDGKPAVISFTSPTIELSRSATVLSHERADTILALPQVTVARFEVFGSTAMEAIESARLRGHFSENGAGRRLNSRPAGHTSWRVEWAVTNDPKNPSGDPQLTITWGAFVVMPEWKGPPAGDEGRVSRPHEINQWEDFCRHLRTHEAHHVEGVVTRLEETIATWKKNNSMPRTIEEANQAMRAVISDISLHDQAIDQRYGHQ